MKKLQLQGAEARSAAHRSRNLDGPGKQGIRRPASVLHPVVDPSVTQGDKRSHRGRRFRDLAGIVVVLLRTVRGRRRHVRPELNVQATDGRALNRVVTVGDDVVADEKYSLPATATVNREVAGRDDHSLT